MACALSYRFRSRALARLSLMFLSPCEIFAPAFCFIVPNLSLMRAMRSFAASLRLSNDAFMRATAPFRFRACALDSPFAPSSLVAVVSLDVLLCLSRGAHLTFVVSSISSASESVLSVIDGDVALIDWCCQ